LRRNPEIGLPFVEASFYSVIMNTAATERDVTLWMSGDVPARMLYAGRRWRVTDTPTLIRMPAPAAHCGGGSGWRFQATDERGATFVFDVYGSTAGWHVHRAYE
jgi:hypothetical protein